MKLIILFFLLSSSLYKSECNSPAKDGDTVVLKVDLGFDIYVIKPVRLYGVNTPELRGRDSLIAIRAKAYLTHRTLNNKNLYFEDKGKDKYGRLLGNIYEIVGKDTCLINNEMLRYGVEYFGGKKTN